MENSLSAEVISAKFVLREIIIFFLQKRPKVIGDKDITFTSDELISFIKKIKNVTIKKKDIESYLDCLKDFNKRDEELIELEPRTKLLDYKTNQSKITIINCTTNDLKYILRFIDISIYLKERPEDYKERSLFKITQDGKLKFMERISKNSFETKEKAIFYHLRKHFNKKCDYKDLFKKASEAQRASGNSLHNTYRTASKRKTYINNGITQLRTKIINISGNPCAIETIEERTSKYKLIY